MYRHSLFRKQIHIPARTVIHSTNPTKSQKPLNYNQYQASTLKIKERALLTT